jgi:hypothetical protein
MRAKRARQSTELPMSRECRPGHRLRPHLSEG